MITITEGRKRDGKQDLSRLPLLQNGQSIHGLKLQKTKLDDIRMEAKNRKVAGKRNKDQRYFATSNFPFS